MRVIGMLSLLIGALCAMQVHASWNSSIPRYSYTQGDRIYMKINRSGKLVWVKGRYDGVDGGPRYAERVRVKRTDGKQYLLLRQKNFNPFNDLKKNIKPGDPIQFRYPSEGWLANGSYQYGKMHQGELIEYVFTALVTDRYGIQRQIPFDRVSKEERSPDDTRGGDPPIAPTTRVHAKPARSNPPVRGTDKMASTSGATRACASKATMRGRLFGSATVNTRTNTTPRSPSVQPVGDSAHKPFADVLTLKNNKTKHSGCNESVPELSLIQRLLKAGGVRSDHLEWKKKSLSKDQTWLISEMKRIDPHVDKQFIRNFIERDQVTPLDLKFLKPKELQQKYDVDLAFAEKLVELRSPDL